MDIAVLGISIEMKNGELAITRLKEIERAGAATEKQTDALTAKFRQQDQALRAVAESDLRVTDTGNRMAQAIIAQNGGMQRFLEIQKQIDEEMRIADQVATQRAATMVNLTATIDGGHAAVWRLRQGFSSLGAQLAGVHPIVGQMAGVLGAFAIGSTLTVGILAGLAAVGFAYNKLTEDSRKLKEETDKAVASLEKLRQAEQGSTFQVSSEIALADARITALRNKLKVAQQLTGGEANPSGDPGYGPTAEQIAEQRRNIAVLNAQIAAGVRERQRIIDEGAAGTRNTLDSTLAYLIKNHQAEAGDRANALVLLRAYQNDYKQLAVTDLAGRRALAEQINELNDALFPKGTKHVNEMAVAMKRLKDLVESLKLAWGDLRAGAEVSANIDRTVADSGLIGSKKPNGYEEDLQKAHNAVALRIADERQQQEKYRQEAEKRDRESAQKYADDMHAIWTRGIGKIVTDGTKSFRDFFEDVLQMFSKLMARMQEEGKASGGMYKALGLGSAAITGVFGGYQVGQTTTNRGLGALGGAASGAAAGAEIAGPWGAVIGGVTGAIGGFFGAGSAAKKAAEELKKQQEAQATLSATMEILRQKTAGANTTLAEAIEANRQYYEQLKLQINAAYAGKKNEEERNRRRAVADQMAAQDAVRIREEIELKRKQSQEDLTVRALVAAGATEAADNMRFALQQQREYAQAVKDGADFTTLAILREVQKAEAEQRAADAAKKAADAVKAAADAFLQAAENARRFSEAVAGRAFAALGMNRQAEDVRMASSQRQEMYDAVKAGMGPLELAQLAFAQILERQQLVLQRDIEDQTKVIRDAAAAQINAIDDQMAAIKLIAEDQAAAYQKQIDTANEALTVAKSQLQAQQQAVQETQRVFDSLTQFGASLKLNTGLTALSPIEQLAESKRQYDELLAKANAGDKTAGGNLPAAAQAFLNASRAVNASGPGYVSDFQRVQHDIAAITDRFGNQLTTEQRILAELQAQTDQLETQIKTLQAAKDAAAASAAKQIDALQKAKDQASADADRQVLEMTKQLTEAQQKANSDSSWYQKMYSNLQDQLNAARAFYEDEIARLERLITNTTPGPRPPPVIIPDPMVPGGIPALVKASSDTNAKLDATNARLDALVAVSATGFRQTIDGQAAVVEVVRENTAQARQGFEGLKV